MFYWFAVIENIFQNSTLGKANNRYINFGLHFSNTTTIAKTISVSVFKWKFTELPKDVTYVYISRVKWIRDEIHCSYISDKDKASQGRGSLRALARRQLCLTNYFKDCWYELTEYLEQITYIYLKGSLKLTIYL